MFPGEICLVFLPCWIVGGLGCVMYICSMHLLREFMIYWNLFGVFSHCVWVSCSFCNVVVRVVIARLCVSKVIWSFWRLAGCMGYVIRGLFV